MAGRDERGVCDLRDDLTHLLGLFTPWNRAARAREVNRVGRWRKRALLARLGRLTPVQLERARILFWRGQLPPYSQTWPNEAPPRQQASGADGLCAALAPTLRQAVPTGSTARC